MKGRVTPLAPWRRRLLVPFLVLAAVNAVAFLAFTLPRSLRQANLASRVGALKVELDQQARLVASLRRQADAATANSGDARRFFEEIVDTRDAAYVPTLQEIEKMVAAPGLKPGSRSFGEEDVKGLPLQGVQISLPLEGTYRQLVEFLRRVERSKAFLTVDKVQLHEKAGAGVKAGTLSVQLTAYFLKEQGAARGAH